MDSLCCELAGYRRVSAHNCDRLCTSSSRHGNIDDNDA